MASSTAPNGYLATAVLYMSDPHTVIIGYRERYVKTEVPKYLSLDRRASGYTLGGMVKDPKKAERDERAELEESLRASQKTSLNLDPAVYRRAWDYKLNVNQSRKPGAKRMELGDLVTEALDEYLKKRGA